MSISLTALFARDLLPGIGLNGGLLSTGAFITVPVFPSLNILLPYGLGSPAPTTTISTSGVHKAIDSEKSEFLLADVEQADTNDTLYAFFQGEFRGDSYALPSPGTSLTLTTQSELAEAETLNLADLAAASTLWTAPQITETPEISVDMTVSSVGSVFGALAIDLSNNGKVEADQGDGMLINLDAIVQLPSDDEPEFITVEQTVTVPGTPPSYGPPAGMYQVQNGVYKQGNVVWIDVTAPGHGTINYNLSGYPDIVIFASNKGATSIRDVNVTGYSPGSKAYVNDMSASMGDWWNPGWDVTLPNGATSDVSINGSVGQYMTNYPAMPTSPSFFKPGTPATTTTEMVEVPNPDYMGAIEVDGAAVYGDQGGTFANGYANLAANEDDNGDGVINGAELDNIALWVDDGDGILETGEIRSLSDEGVVELQASFEAVLENFDGVGENRLLIDLNEIPVLPSTDEPEFITVQQEILSETADNKRKTGTFFVLDEMPNLGANPGVSLNVESIGQFTFHDRVSTHWADTGSVNVGDLIDRQVVTKAHFFYADYYASGVDAGSITMNDGTVLTKEDNNEATYRFAVQFYELADGTALATLGGKGASTGTYQSVIITDEVIENGSGVASIDLGATGSVHNGRFMFNEHADLSDMGDEIFGPAGGTGVFEDIEIANPDYVASVNVDSEAIIGGDYSKLDARDLDGDGSVSGAELDGLAIWADDGDGVLEAGEIQTLDEAAIDAFSTDSSGEQPASTATVILQNDGSDLATREDRLMEATDDFFFQATTYDATEVENAGFTSAGDYLGSQSNDQIVDLQGDGWIFAMEGDDIVKGEAGDDAIYGGAGNDKLLGGEGQDLLDGGAGTDVLIGGADIDIFVFRKGDGVADIADFELGYDILDVEGFANLTYEALSDAGEQIGDDVFYQIDADTLILRGVELSTMLEIDLCMK